MVFTFIITIHVFREDLGVDVMMILKWFLKK
jgi:hypothetical protein